MLDFRSSPSSLLLPPPLDPFPDWESLAEYFGVCFTITSLSEDDDEEVDDDDDEVEDDEDVEEDDDDEEEEEDEDEEDPSYAPFLKNSTENFGVCRATGSTSSSSSSCDSSIPKARSAL